jgi:predicted MPP superfamily phosphohydrolase
MKKINALQPDVVLIAGDIIDESLAPVIWKDLGKMFLEINSKYGVYAVTGNHEFIGGAERAINYISKYGVKFLRDETVLIDNSFYIFGREDRDVSRFTKTHRKQISELMISADSSFPTILLDHQPFDLSETAKNKIDLQISGHTHHGQMFPFNLITKKIFEVSRGYKKISDTHFYVSSGVGTWGPPVRIGSRAEILNIQISLE